ncbi:hypothetical protein JDV02_010645 [Purpureocillium takamizusanense]|uniref:Uncharacterized protein n=1 Tax=Purpureocillium takamizusanense TaxID=2060973 RepID=A0A9Q8QUE6_9HYPO|nr:uncharacterized protein JDV02_010645 [Purpureocillium takamizusanense]UNI24929.1 hypothetical protein JDV02_010645 [Purpureocillium takamizusanense]
MQFPWTLTLCCLVAVVSGLVARQPNANSTLPGSTAPIPGYSLFVPSWEVEVRTGERVVLNGTVHEVHHQLLKLNPDWESFAASRRKRSVLERRGPSPDTTDHKCGGHPKGSKYYPKVLKDTAESLFWTDGVPKSAAGPQTCARIGCELDTGTWWCNHDTKEKSLEAWSNVANVVKKMYRERLCWQERATEVSHPDKWSVLVAGEDGLKC